VTNPTALLHSSFIVLPFLSAIPSVFAVTLGMQQSQDTLGQKKSTENERQWTEREGGRGGRIFGSKSQTKDLDCHCEKGFLCLGG